MQRFPLSREELEQASQEEMFVKDGRPYIVRTLMDYQAHEPNGLCSIVMELNAKALFEQFSFLCQGDESVALLVLGQALEGADSPETPLKKTGDYQQHGSLLPANFLGHRNGPLPAFHG